MSVVLDPAVVLLARASVSLLFVVAAAHKLLHLHQFTATLEAYELVGRRFSAALARVLPLLELAAAIGLWVGAARLFAMLLAVSLLLTYAAAIAINLARGRRDLDCGCTAFGRRSPIGAWMIGRNSILALCAALAAAPTTSRALALTDGLTVAGGLCVLTLIYVAADTLFASVARVEFQS
ncbi:MAG TPA: MauE/DoxX family redox-associated membrane protein [Steroidobacteraceae bacterium]|nr:MauE/DoxX family redox-associated membrane protein [Steroidobacteraceae bacterium]